MPAVVSPLSRLPPSGASHHELPVHEVVLLLGTDPHRGLETAEAALRLERFGPNELPEPARVGVLRRALGQFHHPLIYVLLAAAVITGLLREYVDCAVILGVVLVNAAVGFLQESRAEAALESLRSMVCTTAQVIRAGRHHRLPSEELVVGDLVVLEAGDKVPADLRLIRIADLQVDESALTGESVPVVQDEVVLPEATPVADRRNMAYSGTLVTTGTAAGIAVGTGGSAGSSSPVRTSSWQIRETVSPSSRSFRRSVTILGGQIAQHDLPSRACEGHRQRFGGVDRQRQADDPDDRVGGRPGLPAPARLRMKKDMRPASRQAPAICRSRKCAFDPEAGTFGTGPGVASDQCRPGLPGRSQQISDKRS